MAPRPAKLKKEDVKALAKKAKPKNLAKESTVKILKANTKSKKPDPRYIPNRHALGIELGHSVNHMAFYAMHGLPVTSKGYDVEECRQWISRFEQIERPKILAVNMANKQAKMAARVNDRKKAKALLKSGLIKSTMDPVEGQSSPPEESEILDELSSLGSEEDTESLKINKLKAEIKKLRQEGRGRKLKNDEYAGLLLPSDEVRQWIGSRFLRIKNRLQMLPAELQMIAPTSLRPQLYQDLTSAIHELLLEMSSWEAQVERGNFEGLVT